MKLKRQNAFPTGAYVTGVEDGGRFILFVAGHYFRCREARAGSMMENGTSFMISEFLCSEEYLSSCTGIRRYNGSSLMHIYSKHVTVYRYFQD